MITFQSSSIFGGGLGTSFKKSACSARNKAISNPAYDSATIIAANAFAIGFGTFDSSTTLSKIMMADSWPTLYQTLTVTTVYTEGTGTGGTFQATWNQDDSGYTVNQSDSGVVTEDFNAINSISATEIVFAWGPVGTPSASGTTTYTLSNPLTLPTAVPNSLLNQLNPATFKTLTGVDIYPVPANGSDPSNWGLAAPIYGFVADSEGHPSYVSNTSILGAVTTAAADTIAFRMARSAGEGGTTVLAPYDGSVEGQNNGSYYVTSGFDFPSWPLQLPFYAAGSNTLPATGFEVNALVSQMSIWYLSGKNAMSAPTLTPSNKTLYSCVFASDPLIKAPNVTPAIGDAATTVGTYTTFPTFAFFAPDGVSALPGPIKFGCPVGGMLGFGPTINHD